jgi:hypothetical protein
VTDQGTSNPQFARAGALRGQAQDSAKRTQGRKPLLFGLAGLGCLAGVSVLADQPPTSFQGPAPTSSGQVQTAPPAPSVPAGTPETGSPHLNVDIGKAIAEVVARMLATPRFEEHVEVRDRYQEALNSYLRASNLGCGATSSGAPPYDEMNRFREARIPPHADLLAGGKWLLGKLKRHGASKGGRFYLYSVGAKSAPGRVVYVVRDGAISEDSRSSVPGTSWELVGTYADQGKASAAVARLQRGGSADEVGRSQVLWATTGCPH